jgi:hypothetical protein
VGSPKTARTGPRHATTARALSLCARPGATGTRPRRKTPAAEVAEADARGYAAGQPRRSEPGQRLARSLINRPGVAPPPATRAVSCPWLVPRRVPPRPGLRLERAPHDRETRLGPQAPYHGKTAASGDGATAVGATA